MEPKRAPGMGLAIHPVNEGGLLVPPTSSKKSTKRRDGPSEGKPTKRARRQVDISCRKLQRPEGTYEYNIWYHKYIDFDYKDKTPVKAETRCDSLTDCGATLAEDNAYLCYHFAKGCCSQGHECNYKHRLPCAEDQNQIAHIFDIFGRSRHAYDRDDMGGVGSFNRDCRTLYVGNVGHLKTRSRFQDNRDLREKNGGRDTPAIEVLARHFGEWGEIEDISFKPQFGCAFIRFKMRIAAEFAKVAMAGQELDTDEILNIRWAYDDPNPKAIQRVEDEHKEELFEQIKDLGYSFDRTRVPYDVPVGYVHPGEKAQQVPYHPDYDGYGYHIATGVYCGTYDLSKQQADPSSFQYQQTLRSDPASADFHDQQVPYTEASMFQQAGYRYSYDHQDQPEQLTMPKRVKAGPETQEQIEERKARLALINEQAKKERQLSSFSSLLDKIDASASKSNKAKPEPTPAETEAQCEWEVPDPHHSLMLSHHVPFAAQPPRRPAHMQPQAQPPQEAPCLPPGLF